MTLYMQDHQHMQKKILLQLGHHSLGKGEEGVWLSGCTKLSVSVIGIELFNNILNRHVIGNYDDDSSEDEEDDDDYIAEQPDSSISGLLIQTLVMDEEPTGAYSQCHSTLLCLLIHNLHRWCNTECKGKWCDGWWSQTYVHIHIEWMCLNCLDIQSILQFWDCSMPTVWIDLQAIFRGLLMHFNAHHRPT